MNRKANTDPALPDSSFETSKDIYRALPIPQPLLPFVKQLSLADCLTPVRLRSAVNPSGCAFLGWHFGGQFTGWVNSALEMNSDSSLLHLSGQLHNEAVQVQYEGKIRHLVVQFGALGAYQLLGVIGSDLAGRSVDATGYGSRTRHIAKALSRQFAVDAGDDVDAHVSIMIDHLLSHAEQPLPVPKYVQSAVQSAESNQGAIRVDELAEIADVSERQLNREFTRLVGISPKFFCRTIQLNSAIAKMLDTESNTMADIALHANFTDQAHFNRVFRQFLHSSPTEFLNGDELMIHHFLANQENHK